MTQLKFGFAVFPAFVRGWLSCVSDTLLDFGSALGRGSGAASACDLPHCAGPLRGRTARRSAQGKPPEGGWPVPRIRLGGLGQTGPDDQARHPLRDERQLSEHAGLFVGPRLSPAPAAEALLRAHRELMTRGYGLLIFDAYRPWYVTRIFWDATPADKHEFVADPAKGSRHNREAGLHGLRERVVALRLPGLEELCPPERAIREAPLTLISTPTSSSGSDETPSRP